MSIESINSMTQEQFNDWYDNTVNAPIVIGASQPPTPEQVAKWEEKIAAMSPEQIANEIASWGGSGN